PEPLLSEDSPHAGRARIVDDLRLDQREETERVNARPVLGLERAAVVASVNAVAPAGAAEKVEVRRALVVQRDRPVDEAHDVALFGIPPVVARLRDGVVTGIPRPD